MNEHYKKDMVRAPFHALLGIQVTTASLRRSSWPALPAARPPARHRRPHPRPPSAPPDCPRLHARCPGPVTGSRRPTVPPRLTRRCARPPPASPADAPRAALLLLAHTPKPAPSVHSLTLNTTLEALLHKHGFMQSTSSLYFFFESFPLFLPFSAARLICLIPSLFWLGDLSHFFVPEI
ncbi:hypothetical protein C8J57DRAFT_1492144 [Mycena rebaudengoi]|nr:hypothetical protein C8J57DRAFT_1492144 [Mycena rebaudengoi]